MNYYTPAPPRASRRQHFLLGLASGVFVMSAVMLLLAVARPRHDLPKFSELALVCQPAGLPITSESQMIPARLETNNSFTCFGGVK